MNDLANRIYGCLIGLVFADAVGSRFEGMQQEQLRAKFRDKTSALEYALAPESLRYTDDGQMALAIAQHLVEHSAIVSDELMARFVDVYESWRGYGRGARVLIEAFRDNAEYEFMAEHLFPGGSLGNGAAMRSAPIGLRFIGDIERIWQEAKNSAWPTHRHELGIEGAQIIAAATSFAGLQAEIDASSLAEFFLPICSTTVFTNRLGRLLEVKSDADVEQFGNGIEAHESVVTALGCFALYPSDYRAAVALAIWQGGDTDTIAAMTGALVGAHVGSAIADDLPLSKLEEGLTFTSKVRRLAEQLAVNTKK